MTQTITLNLPDRLFDPIQRIAQATDRSVEAILLDVLQNSLPSLDGLPPDLIQELTELETLDNDTLRHFMLDTVPLDQQQSLETLLQHNQMGELSEVEKERLTSLQKEADKIMIRKARAAVLLRFRGQRIPTLAELSELTSPTAE
jgi:hypothetical protein